MNLTLQPLTRRQIAKILDSNDTAPTDPIAPNATEIAGMLKDVATAHLARYDRTGAEEPWIGYLVQLDGDGPIVGVCGFKDRVRDGRVEIACSTFPRFEGRGYGRVMASQLVALAKWNPAVREILAHTPPEETAAGSIPARLGFRSKGLVEDPENGTMRQWVLTIGQDDH